MKKTPIIGLLLVIIPACSRKAADEVLVFHAASLTRVLGELERKFESRRPQIDIRLEPSGSQVAARKISELQRRADLVISADPRLIEKLLIPHHASWQAAFAGNELALIFGQHSPHADEITSANWGEILLREDVRLGRCNEATSPLGYQTLQVWQLAERHCQKIEGLARRLRQKVRTQDVTPDAEELLARLQARTIDYAFAFVSLAEEYSLRQVRLDDACNLASPERAALYSEALVEVELERGQREQLQGQPVAFSFTVPRRAANPGGALDFIQLLIGPEGRSQLERSGFRPYAQARCISASPCPAEIVGPAVLP